MFPRFFAFGSTTRLRFALNDKKRITRHGKNLKNSVFLRVLCGAKNQHKKKWMRISTHPLEMAIFT